MGQERKTISQLGLASVVTADPLRDEKDLFYSSAAAHTRRLLASAQTPMRLFRPDFPFDPARLPFFYGWAILVVATLGVVMSIPGQTMGVSVFTDHLIEVTGLSRLQLASAYLVGTLGSSLILPWGGGLLDRFGSRITAATSCLCLAATLLVLSRADHIARTLAYGFGLESATPAAALVLTLGFTLLRFSGQGILTMSSRTMLSKWFERRRGLTSGIAGMFISFGFASAPPILQGMIDLSDWRGAWVGLGLAVGVGMSAIAWIFFRDNPEECGLRMDGRPVEANTASSEGAAGIEQEPCYTRGQALRTAGFWYVTLAASMQAMVFTGVTFHIVDIGNLAGIGGEAALRLFFPIAVISTISGLISGWAADRVGIRSLVVVFLTTQIVGYLGASQLGAPHHIPMLVAGWGISSGLFGTILAVAMPGFFGRLHLGAIASVQMSCMVAGSALGPAALAAAKDYLGSYRMGMLGFCGVAGAILVFSIVARNPRPRA